jgi:hypothetical protein
MNFKYLVKLSEFKLDGLALRQKETRQGRRMFGGWDENPRRYKSGFDQQAKLAQDVKDGLER